MIHRTTFGAADISRTASADEPPPQNLTGRTFMNGHDCSLRSFLGLGVAVFGVVFLFVLSCFRSLGAFGYFLGPRGAHLERPDSWVLFGSSWVLLGSSWVLLGSSWVLLGSSLGVLWECLGDLECYVGVLGHCLELLGRSWVLLGRSWKFIGSSRELVRNSLVLLETSLGAPWESWG